jgi:hypothetical protein
MPDLPLTGAAVLASAVAAALPLLLAAWARRPLLLRLGWVLGMGAGVYAGCAVLALRPRWPAPEDRDRFLVVLLPLTLAVEIVAAIAPRPRWPARLLRLCVAAAATPILLFNSVYLVDLSGPHSAEWPPALAAVILGLLGAALAAVWALLALLRTRTSDRTAPAVLALATLAAGVTVMLSGYFSGGLMGLPMAAALAGATLASFAAPAESSARGGLGVGVVGLFTVLAIGRFFGSLPTGPGLCLLLAPLLAWLPEAPGLRKLRPGLRAAARLLVVAVPLALVVADAKMRFDEAAASHYGSFEP